MVSDTLLHPRDETISPIDQLKLARRVASGVLQFHSTPWLKNDWGLRDLCFFGRETDVSDLNLQTLHLTGDVTSTRPTRRIDLDGDLPMEGNEPLALTVDYCEAQTTEDGALEYEVYGIRNATLYRLGVALLEIGYWRKLNVADVVKNRQLANPRRGRRVVYPRYLEIAKRCLDCDFAFGTDLTKSSLLNAVQDRVLKELDTMIAAIDISRD